MIGQSDNFGFGFTTHSAVQRFIFSDWFIALVMFVVIGQMCMHLSNDKTI